MSCSEIQRNNASLPTTLLKFCREVAEGLSYLAGKSFVHRDIAARNILLDKELNCKVRGQWEEEKKLLIICHEYNEWKNGKGVCYQSSKTMCE